MMLRRACIIVLLLSATAVAKDAIQKQTLRFDNHERTYYLFVPTNAPQPAPLLLLLHGSGAKGRMMVDAWRDLAAKEGIVLVAPDSLDPTGWNGRNDSSNFLYAVIEAVRTAQAIDGRRMYVFGHSAGGVFALLLSLFEPEYFAATAVHAGALPSNARLIPNPSARKIPIKIFVGTEDPRLPLPDARATRDFLQQNGYPVELVEMARQTHAYYDTASKINADAWRFLKQHSVAEPRFLE